MHCIFNSLFGVWTWLVKLAWSFVFDYDIMYGLRLETMNKKPNNLFICLFSLSSASSSACAGFRFSIIWCNWSCHCRSWWDSAAFSCIIQKLCIWQQDTVVRGWLHKYIKVLQLFLIQVKFCCLLCNSKQFTNLKFTTNIDDLILTVIYADEFLKKCFPIPYNIIIVTIIFKKYILNYKRIIFLHLNCRNFKGTTGSKNRWVVNQIFILILL